MVRVTNRKENGKICLVVDIARPLTSFFNDLYGPLTRFQGHGTFDIEYIKDILCLRDKVTIKR